jgi:PAS domain S-box-containing protein
MLPNNCSDSASPGIPVEGYGQEGESLFRALFENALDGMVVLDDSGRLVAVNPAASSLLGLTDRAWMDCSIADFLDEDIQGAWQMILARGRDRRDIQLRRLDGDMRTVEYTAIANILPHRHLAILRDVTERQRIESERQQAHRFLQAIIDHLPVALFVKDGREESFGTFRLWNQTSEQLFGLSNEEVLGKGDRDFFPPEQVEFFARKDREAFERGTVEDILEETVDSRSLGRRILHTVKVPIFDENHQPLYLVGISEDITEHKQTKAALELSEERLQLVLEGSGDGWWDWNIFTGEVYLSPRWLEMLGYEVGELPGHVNTWETLIHPDDRPWVIDTLNAHLRNPSVPYAFDYRVLCKSGEWKWIANYGKVVAFDKSGHPQRMAGTHKDISDRKRVEAALQESEERWQLALKGNNDGIWDWNLKTNETFFSTRWKEMLGFGDGDISNRFEELSERVHPDDLEWVMQRTQDHLAQKTPFFVAEYRLRCKDGSYKWVLDRGQALWDEDGTAIRMVGSHTDITERKATEADLQRQNRHLHLIADLTLKIRQSPKLEDVLRTTVTEIQEVLQTDRTVVFRLHSNGAGSVVQEAVKPGWPAILGNYIVDPCFRSEYLDRYREGRVSAIADLEASSIQSCHKDLLQQFGVRANLIVPISIQEQLWGLLIAHQCDAPRQWHPLDIELLRQLGDRIGIAISQAQLLNHLEERVSERTAELTVINHQLQEEIRDRKQIEAALRNSREILSGILDSAEEAIISVDNNQIIQLYNQGAEKIFGYPPDEVLGKPLDLLLPPSSRQQHRQHVQDFARSPAVSRPMGERSGRIVGRRKNGEVFPAEASISKLELSDRTIFTAILKDISDRLAIDRMKNEFVSVVSHELRTPLTSVHGSLKLLATGRLGELSERGQQLIEIAVNNTERLTRLINDVLDLERIESGKVVMTRQLCDATDLATQAAAAMQAMAQEHGIALSLTLVPASISADPDHILQTLTNLLSNAIKFSAAGSTVSLSVAHRGSEVLFQVQDRGRGIPADKLSSIFERFHQVDASDSRQKGGTGLGLAISREIVERHGGRIWAESTPGEGSTFSFTLPNAQCI